MPKFFFKLKYPILNLFLAQFLNFGGKKCFPKNLTCNEQFNKSF